MVTKRWRVFCLALVATLLMTACAPATTADEEAQRRIEELEQQLADAQAGGGDTADIEAELAAAQAALEAANATATAQAAAEAGGFESYSVEFKNPDTFTHLVIGEPETLDPAVAYDSASMQVLNNVYDKLVFFKGSSFDEYVPMLAEEWSVSDDGLTYTFQLREGVTFHAGGALEPHDVEYTFHRNFLLGWDALGAGGPMGLFFDPLFSVEGIGAEGDGGLYDAVKAENPGASEAELDVLICEKIKTAVVADDEAGTVVMTLSYPAAFYPQLLAQYWGAIMDKEWMIEQGAWDGDCGTWREWYLPEVSASTLYGVANGTGPYKLDHWTAGDELVLVANEEWWVTEPLWEGSTVDGVPEIQTIVIKLVEEWGTRLAMMQAGDADMIDPELAFSAQIDPMVKEWVDVPTATTTEHNPNGTLRMYHNLAAANTTDMFFNFNVTTEGGNTYIGTGQLDGRGVPPDFFSDIHVRKAFNYCFDLETFIEEVRQGEAIPHRGPIIEGMPGYQPDSDLYPFDLAKCEEEFKLAYDGQLWDIGFLVTLVYNSGNDSRRIAMEILKTNIEAVNPNFQIVLANLPWPTYLADRRAGRFAMHQTGWIEDFHHPHNWVYPYMACSGYFANQQHLPEELCASWGELMFQAVRETDQEAARAIYEQLQAEAMEQAIDIFGYQTTERDYVQLWIQGYYYNPLFGNSTPYYASLQKVAP